MGDANIETAELNLLAEGSVPDDADAVMIAAPASDLTAEEASALLAYVEGGGSLLVFTDYGSYSTEGMPNLAGILNTYGMEAQESVVVEGDPARCLNGYPYYLLPVIEQAEAAGDLADKSAYVLVPLAHGIAEIDSHRSSVSVEPVLSTSEDAYIKVDPNNAQTLEQEDGDIAGGTWVGAAATESTDEGTARVVWFSTSQILSSENDLRVGGANSRLVVSAASWLADSDVVSVDIAAKGLGDSYLVIDATTAQFLSALPIGIVPCAVLGCGFYIWHSRRRR